MSSWYEFGSTVTLSITAESGATVTLTVTAPDGTKTTPTPTFSGGSWSADVTGDQYDDWLYAWVVDGVVTTGTFTVGGPWYGTLASAKKRVNRSAADTSPDDLVAAALLAASRDVEQYCDSRPIGAFSLDATSSTRTYRPTNRGPTLPGMVMYLDCEYRLYVHEFGNATFTVETSDDGSTWTTLTENTDFYTYPANAIALSLPVEALVSSTAWPAQVRVTARWGWPATPWQVTEATLLHASRLYRRKDSPDGVAASGDWGAIRVVYSDPDFKRLLGWLHTEALVG